MNVKLRPDATLNDLALLIAARLKLRDAQDQLRIARTRPKWNAVISIHETLVGQALDNLWEVQQSVT